MADDGASVVPQLLGAAVGIVIGSAILFALLGSLRSDPAVEVTDPPTAAPTATDESTASADPAETAAASPTATAEPTTSEPEPEPTEPEPSATASVPPEEVSIQVLDAADGSSAAQAVADELSEGGYDVVVVNPAGTGYDVTTVFWSPEQEDAGRQVAAFIETDEARATPDEVQLSDSVDVHVVVGDDRS